MALMAATMSAESAPAERFMVEGYGVTIYLYGEGLSIVSANGNRLDVSTSSCRSSEVVEIPVGHGNWIELQLRLVIALDSSSPTGDPALSEVRIHVGCPPEAGMDLRALDEALRSRRAQYRAQHRSSSKPDVIALVPALRPLPHRGVPDTEGWLSFRPLASSAEVIAPR
jgi:hypothetical protein